MSLLAPLALLGLLFVPLILAFYMLRLRRTEQTVSSTYLWQQLVRDVEANAPWQRLRRSLLLLLQLLLVIALALVVARPFSERPAELAHDIVLVVDASASMSATDEFPTRLAAAKRAALDALAELPQGGRVSVIAAATTARVVANEVTDRTRLAAVVESIAPSNGPARMDDAMKLADALAARAEGTQILVATDGAGKAASTRVRAPVRVVAVGRDRHNQAIVALAVRADASGVKRSVFVSVANLDVQAATRRLQILADGVPVSARDLTLEPLRRAEVVIDEVPAGTVVVEARLGRTEDAPAGGAPVDQLPVDDAAWAVVPSDRLQRILLVGPGNVYLQNALSLLPNVELYGVTPQEYPTTTGKELFDLVVLDGFLPAQLPAKPTLAIAPPSTSALGVISGTLKEPPLGQPDPGEPLLRNVDLTRVHVATAQQLQRPEWARTVIPGPEESPLLYSGLRDGVPTAVLAFDLRQSDLPLQVAWPVLAANLAGELLGLNPEATAPVAPGSAIELALPPGATGMRITRPDGGVVELPVGARGASSVTFVGTDQLGVYQAEPILPAGATPAAPSAAGASAPPVRPGREPGEISFAVDLFDPEESNIAPTSGEAIAALGAQGNAAGRQPGEARDEWWIPLALLVLGLLMLEWLVYERDGARRLVQFVRRARPATLAVRRRG